MFLKESRCLFASVLRPRPCTISVRTLLLRVHFALCLIVSKKDRNAVGAYLW